MFTLSTIAYLGKPGFNYLKRLLLGFVKKHGLPKKVNRTRYYVGLVMFVVPLFYGLLEAYLGHFIPGYEAHRLAYSKVSDLVLVASLFVLGGEFWDKLRALFIYEAKAQIP